MEIILEQRIPDPKIQYGYKNIIVKGNETEDLVGQMEGKYHAWKTAITGKAINPDTDTNELVDGMYVVWKNGEKKVVSIQTMVTKRKVFFNDYAEGDIMVLNSKDLTI